MIDLGPCSIGFSVAAVSRAFACPERHETPLGQRADGLRRTRTSWVFHSQTLGRLKKPRCLVMHLRRYKQRSAHRRALTDHARGRAVFFCSPRLAGPHDVDAKPLATAADEEPSRHPKGTAGAGAGAAVKALVQCRTPDPGLAREGLSPGDADWVQILKVSLEALQAMLGEGAQRIWTLEMWRFSWPRKGPSGKLRMRIHAFPMRIVGVFGEIRGVWKARGVPHEAFPEARCGGCVRSFWRVTRRSTEDALAGDSGP